MKSKLKYLRKCIELAKANNINIYLYESPVYNESKKYNLNRAEFLNKIDDISKTYDINYLKFDTLPMSFENKNYFNALNTTLAGTDEFSFIFGNYIKNKILN